MERTGARSRSFSSAELAAPPDRMSCRVVADEAERALHMAIRELTPHHRNPERPVWHLGHRRA